MFSLKLANGAGAIPYSDRLSGSRNCVFRLTLRCAPQHRLNLRDALPFRPQRRAIQNGFAKSRLVLRRAIRLRHNLGV